MAVEGLMACQRGLLACQRDLRTCKKGQKTGQNGLGEHMEGHMVGAKFSTLSPKGAAAQKTDLGLNADTLTAPTVRASALRINTGFLIGRVSKIRILGLNADKTSGFFIGRVLTSTAAVNECVD